MLTPFVVRVKRRWRSIVVFVTPIILLPLLLYEPTPESKCAFVILLVGTFWVTSVVPLAVSSLLPIALFPLLGIIKSSSIGAFYMKETNLMMLAGLTAAIAIEHCNLHRRIALRILLLAGTSPKWLMLGFMAASAFLSMWISNTATTSLMIPIVECILQELTVGFEKEENGPDNFALQPTNGSDTERDTTSRRSSTAEVQLSNALKRRPSMVDRMQGYRKATFIAIAYASNFGGSATTTGTGPNLVLMEYLASNYPGAATGLTFASWMLFQVPCAIICLICTWLWLQIAFFGIRSLCESTSKESSVRIKASIRRQYTELGPMTFHETIILTLFSILILLWFFRQPEFMPGWSSLLEADYAKDSVAGIGIIFLMFVLPSKRDFLCGDCSQLEPPPRALTWTVVQKKLPWGMLLIMGGGYALAEGSKVSGLSELIGSSLTGLSTLPHYAIVIIMSIVASLITEIASNVAAAMIILPVLSNMADSLKLNPLSLMLPATLACSFAFILPVSTPPNALIYDLCGVSTGSMVKPGVVTKIISIIILIIMINTLGVFIFNLNETPSWAKLPEKVVNNITCPV